jgi:hypothetical protein
MPNYALIRPQMRTLVVLAALSAGVGGWSCSAASDAQSGSPMLHPPVPPVTTHGGSSGAGDAIPPDLNLDQGGSSNLGQGGGAVCNAQVRDGQRVPIDMYFLVDSSGSMSEPVLGGSKWDVVSSALVSFLNDPRNNSTGIGIGYFPGSAQTACAPGVAGCLCIPGINICIATDGGSCTVSDYAKPAVPLALPPQLGAIVSDITGHRISGGTPTRPALEGALQYLDQWASQHPERKPLLVLATDGEPSGCASNVPQDVADVATRALTGPHAIRTFVIGVGRSLVSMNLVAKAGGTDHAFLVDTGGDVAKEFADALDQIRGAASSCDFIIPSASAAGEAIDPLKVNVSITASGSSTPMTVPQTFNGDPKNCDTAGGWYYDNPAAPTMIKLCDATCRALNGSAIQVAFGCDTIEQPPR